MKPNPPILGSRPDIEGLRAIAVVSVVIFHAFPKFIRGAFFGVDIFFVISGYLISLMLIRDYEKSNFSYSRFYLRRARRLFPALFVVLTSITVLGWFLLLPQEYARFGKHLAAGVGFVANLTLLAESGYFDTGGHEKPLLHLWSLGVEEQYYLIWPLLISMALWAKALVRVIVLVIIVSFLGNIFFIQHHPAAVFFLPLTRIWELASGGLVASIHGCHSVMARGLQHSPMAARWNGAGRQEWISILGLILLITSYHAIQGSEGFPGFNALLPVTGTALLILAGPTTWINRHLLSGRVMAYLGAISYPLYLWHWPLLSLEYIMDKGKRDRAVILGILAVSLLLAHVTWRWIENPLRRVRQAWPVLVLTVLLIGLGAWGWRLHLNKGYPERMPLAAQMVKWQNEMTLMTPGWIRHCPDAIEADNSTICFTRNSPAYPDGRPGLLLTGDSHAAALTGALDEMEPYHELQVIAKGNCMPFAWMDKRKGGRECHPLFKSIYSLAATAPDYSTVILAGRWAMRFHGKGFITDETPLHLFRDVRENYANPEQAILFEQGLRETLTTLTTAGRRVIFMHQIPELGFKPGFCLPRPFSLYPPHPCTISRETVDARQAPYRAVVARILRDYPDVELFDPLPFLCDKQVCRARIDGVFIYSDDNHLSDAGARLLGGKLMTLFHATKWLSSQH